MWTNNSDKGSEVDGDRTLTDENPEEVPNEMADDEHDNEQPKVDPSIPTRSTHKRKAVSNEADNAQTNETTIDVQAEEETEESFHCHICKKSFVNYNNFRAHKMKCWPTTKKHQCEKCGKGFDAKSIMQQHYDFRHTKKLKRFVCEICKKSFELKKTLDEHNMRLHSKGQLQVPV